MVSKVMLWCFGCVFLCGLLKVSEGLKSNDTGVCEVKTSELKTKKVYYRVTVNKWCGKKKCIVTKSKMQKYAVTKKREICCNGFQYQSDTDTCQPLCSTGCNGGKCVAPNVCHCDPPATLEGNTCVTCDPPCFNAKCIANACVCNSNFTSYNASHCYQCDPGFSVDENFNCTPICDKSCVNGDCTAPNTCTCLEGYSKGDNSSCEPRCECVNAKCVASNTCECFKGYVKVNETHCTPKCDNCSNGTCVGPNQCECDDGYNKTDDVCVPICQSNCLHGFCSGPNVCACDEGYYNLDNDTSRSCVKKCPKGSYERNGECVAEKCNTIKQYVPIIY